MAVRLRGWAGCAADRAAEVTYQELFRLSVGPLEDQVQIGPGYEQAGIRFSLTGGQFHVVNAPVRKVMRFSSRGDLLLLLYDPRLNPKPVGLAEAGPDTVSTRRASRRALGVLGRVAADSHGTMYVQERLAPDDWQTEDEVTRSHVVRPIRPHRRRPGVPGQGGCERYAVRVRASPGVTARDELFVVTRDTVAWQVYWFDAEGLLRFRRRLEVADFTDGPEAVEIASVIADPRGPPHLLVEAVMQGMQPDGGSDIWRVAVDGVLYGARLGPEHVDFFWWRTDLLMQTALTGADVGELRLVDSFQMGEIDRAAEERFGIPSPILMENAASRRSARCNSGSGTGRAERCTAAWAALAERINRSRARVIALDAPSGVGDRFAAGMPSVRADWTLALELPKRALYLPAARPACGSIIVVPIGFPAALTGIAGATARLLGPAALPSLLPAVRPDAHKGMRGHVAVLDSLQSARAGRRSGTATARGCSRVRGLGDAARRCRHPPDPGGGAHFGDGRSVVGGRGSRRAHPAIRQPGGGAGMGDRAGSRGVVGTAALELPDLRGVCSGCRDAIYVDRPIFGFASCW
ncbi:Bifunctional NAD(P)H-hydrate repair enzyme Nnr [Geodia barretti]|uniref:Bifunctional NAD(P)H-hydrate repair enzyme Nnr n=1 Tax=Geodia barretti TaxID=519541 RepID=A0AA35WSU6_GEOBA|nr:Bifunctional NAD(P)H-hydrate repair enzyme Nnr [Geodia barretti]